MSNEEPRAAAGGLVRPARQPTSELERVLSAISNVTEDAAYRLRLARAHTLAIADLLGDTNESWQ